MALFNSGAHFGQSALLRKLAERGLALKPLEERLLKLFKISPTELRMVMAAVLLSSFLLVLLKGCTPEAPTPLGGPAEISTLIPAGFVLIPVELKNVKSVDSILGPFGRVDLYVQNPREGSRLIARNVKLLRAPKNPSLFAVLAPQEESIKIMTAEEQGLYAVIKNKAQDGTEFVKPTLKHSRISYSPEDL